MNRLSVFLLLLFWAFGAGVNFSAAEDSDLLNSYIPKTAPATPRAAITAPPQIAAQISTLTTPTAPPTTLRPAAAPIVAEKPPESPPTKPVELAFNKPSDKSLASLNFNLFGSSEIKSPTISTFTNWTGVMARVQQNIDLGEGLCATAGNDPDADCAWDKWQRILASVKNLPPFEQLQKVNDIMNARRYTLDRVNWGMEDYWETVFQFLTKNGDCEDYAIAKYVTLRALGWPTEKLRIVIVRDNKLNLNHAILAVYTDQGVMIGDNQVDGLVRSENIRHYKPIYSINEQSWWLHRPKQN